MGLASLIRLCDALEISVGTLSATAGAGGMMVQSLLQRAACDEAYKVVI